MSQGTIILPSLGKLHSNRVWRLGKFNRIEENFAKVPRISFKVPLDTKLCMSNFLLHQTWDIFAMRPILTSEYATKIGKRSFVSYPKGCLKSKMIILIL